MSVANCPSCGASITFAIGSSEVVVCDSCRSIVARTDRGMETHGVVSGLIDTGSPLAVGVTGKFRGLGYRITGRTQLRHQAGGVWDEWYAAVDDGRWMWVAEAQGRFYITGKTDAQAPPFNALAVGDPSIDGLTIAEVGTAQLLSAEGELPWTPDAGAKYRYADLTGPNTQFATIDYSEEPPLVFKGYEVRLEELGVGNEVVQRSRVAVTTLNCSQCGGALDLKAPDQAERIYCPYCGAGHDVTAGKLQFFAKLKKPRVAPIIPIGHTGTIDGDSYVVAGFMQRAVRFDRDYFWTEYLLYNRGKGYRWLVHSDDHWSWVTPLRPGEVLDSQPRGTAKTVSYQGRTFRIFQNATARVTAVIGEFYWKVELGEQVDTVDYISPPFGISKELTKTGAQEIAYSHARYMTPREVEGAFQLKGFPRPSGVGSMQPFPGGGIGRVYLAMLALLLLVAAIVAVTRPRRAVLNHYVDLGTVVTEGAPENGRAFFTPAFQLSGNANLEVKADAPIYNTWLYLSCDLVNETTGEVQSFEMPLEYYFGTDGGEKWSEGSRTKKEYLSSMARGAHVLRVEAQWEQGKTPPAVTITAREGVFRFSHFLAAFIVLSIFPALSTFRRISWESKRWNESSFTPFGTVSSSGEED